MTDAEVRGRGPLSREALGHERVVEFPGRLRFVMREVRFDGDPAVYRKQVLQQCFSLTTVRDGELSEPVFEWRDVPVVLEG